MRSRLLKIGCLTAQVILHKKSKKTSLGESGERIAFRKRLTTVL